MLKRQRGISFIEVLVALSLFVATMTAFSSLYFMALRYEKSNYYFNVAIQQIHNLWANWSVFQSFQNHTWLDRWNLENQLVLPQGAGKWLGTRDHFSAVVVWGGFKIADCHATQIDLSGCVAV